MNPTNEQKPPAAEKAVNKLGAFEDWLNAKSPRFWVGVLVGGVLLYLVTEYASEQVITRFSKTFQGGHYGPGPLLPWIIGVGLIVAQGIELFSGGTPNLSFNDAHVLALLSLLMYYVILPTIFFISWRRYMLASPDQRKSRAVGNIFVGLVVGAISLPVILVTPFAVYVQVEVGRSMMRGQANASVREGLVGDLAYLTSRAKSFYYVPENLGGAGQNWNHMRRPDGSARPITLEDLKYMETGTNRIMKDLLPKFEGHYVLEVVNDTTLVITGVGNAEGADPKFKNKNGETGKMQVSLTVSPNTDVAPIRENE